jgi:pimeloyl-ACP methyl ester carboxylesterase
MFLLSFSFVMFVTLPLFSQALPDGYYKIQAKHSGKLMDISGASTSDSAQIIQYSSNNAWNQVFHLQYDEQDGYYRIVNSVSEKCLDVQGASTANDADIIQYTVKKSDTANQKFKIELVETGYYKITVKSSGKVLIVHAGSTLNGAHIHQYTWNGKDNQRWKLIPTTKPLDGTTSSGTACATKYPVLLVHGVALGDSTLGFNYFGRIPNYLRSRGAKVEGGEQDAWSNSSDNALQLKNKIAAVRAKYNVTKVNIIAHSKGGIDTRYMFKLYPETIGWVASLTTLSSPMKGSILADIVLGVVPTWAQPYIGNIVNVIGMIIQGDDSPDSLAAGYQLKRSVMADFNTSVNSVDSLASGRTGVYTQSYAARIKGIVLDLALQASGVCMSLSQAGEGPNDGAVWVESAKYANYKGEVSGASWCGGVTHFGIVDRGILVFPGFTPGFDARAFHANIVSDLKTRGY